MIQIGQLDKKITIENLTETRDDVGGFVTTWATYAAVWANVKYKDNEKEIGEQARDTATINVDFKVRYLSGVTVKMRISYDGVYFNITNILPGSTRKEYIILKGEQKV